MTIKDAISDSPGGVLRDVTIPKDTNVWIPMYLLNRDPAVWENPSKFDPSRYVILNEVDYSSAHIMTGGKEKETTLRPKMDSSLLATVAERALEILLHKLKLPYSCVIY